MGNKFKLHIYENAQVLKIVWAINIETNKGCLGEMNHKSKAFCKLSFIEMLSFLYNFYFVIWNTQIPFLNFAIAYDEFLKFSFFIFGAIEDFCQI